MIENTSKINLEDLKKHLEVIPDSNKNIESAKENILADLYDSNSWSLILKQCKEIEIEKTRDIFEAFLKVFPTSVCIILKKKGFVK